MDAKELMINDWVLIDKPDRYAGAKAQIKSLIYHKEGDGQYFMVFICDILGVCSREVFNEDLRPIPVTKEILEKNGFETEDDVHFSIQGQSNMLELLLVELPFDGYYFDIVRTEKTINKCNQRCYIDRYFASIDYVHQLQHALRLCGIEKEIEL